MGLVGQAAWIAAGSLAVLLGAGEGASAQLATGTLVPGDVALRHTAGTSAWCTIEGGSGFYRRSSATQVTIDFPEIFYTVLTTPTAYHHLHGAGRMTFANATAGTVGFALSGEPALAINRPAFSNYSETWDAANKRLTVQFLIKFPSCTAKFLGQFLGP